MNELDRLEECHGTMAVIDNIEHESDDSEYGGPPERKGVELETDTEVSWVSVLTLMKEMNERMCQNNQKFDRFHESMKEMIDERINEGFERMCTEMNTMRKEMSERLNEKTENLERKLEQVEHAMGKLGEQWEKNLRDANQDWEARNDRLMEKIESNDEGVNEIRESTSQEAKNSDQMEVRVCECEGKLAAVEFDQEIVDKFVLDVECNSKMNEAHYKVETEQCESVSGATQLGNLKHRRVRSVNVKLNECKQCNDQVKNLISLKEHMFIYNLNLLEFDFCNFTRNRKYCLRQYLNVNNDIKQFYWNRYKFKAKRK